MNKLILADNQAIYRVGTAKILSTEDDFRIIAQCDTADRIYTALGTFRGAILIFASSLKLDRETLIPRALAAGSRSIVVAEEGEAIQPWFNGGVDGASHRNVTAPALIECVRRVGQGHCGVRAAGMAARRIDEDSVGARARGRLTPRELKVVALIVEGCKNKEIGIRLNNTEQVIKNYLRSIYEKVGVSDRLELALFTIHHRVLNQAAQAVGDRFVQ